MTRRVLESTRSIATQLVKARKDINNILSAEETCLAYKDEIYCCAVLGNTNTNAIYSDLAGRFLIESFNGKKYMFIVCVYKLNSMFMVAMKDRGNTA